MTIFVLNKETPARCRLPTTGVIIQIDMTKVTNFVKGKKPYEKWSKEKMDSYGFNPYLELISKIIYKEQLDYASSEVTPESMEVRVLKEYSASHVDNRHTIRFFDGAHLMLRGLSGNALSMVFYLGKNLEENMNIVSMRRDVCTRFCGMNEQAELKLKAEVDSGKISFYDEKMLNERINRLFRNALKELFEVDIIRKTNRSNSYWLNPKIMMKGKAHFIPNKHNRFNKPPIKIISDVEWMIEDFTIKLVDGVYLLHILDDVIEFDTIYHAIEYVDSNNQ